MGEKKYRELWTRMPVVYFISTKNGPIKIGYTKKLLARFKNIQSCNSEPLEVLGVLFGGEEKETLIHDMFADHKISGEWFRRSDELLSFIRDVAKPHFRGVDLL